MCSCGLRASARVISYAPIVILQIVASLTDDSKDVIYDQNLFIVQATDSLAHASSNTLAFSWSSPFPGTKPYPQMLD